MSDIDRARRARNRATRRERLTKWADKFGWKIEVTWPRGIMGGVLKWCVFVTPVGMLLLASWMMRHRREAWQLTAGLAIIGLLSLGVEAAALHLGANAAIAGVLFFVPSAIVLGYAIRNAVHAREQPDDDPDDEAA